MASASEYRSYAACKCPARNCWLPSSFFAFNALAFWKKKEQNLK